MDFLYSILASLQICLLLNLPAAHALCDAELYGTPKMEDCFSLLKVLPGFLPSLLPDPTVEHTFVEPKFLQPPFCPVQGMAPTSIIQLPKIWRSSQSLLRSNLTIANPSSSCRNMSRLSNQYWWA